MNTKKIPLKVIYNDKAQMKVFLPEDDLNKVLDSMNFSRILLAYDSNDRILEKNVTLVDLNLTNAIIRLVDPPKSAETCKFFTIYYSKLDEEIRTLDIDCSLTIHDLKKMICGDLFEKYLIKLDQNNLQDDQVLRDIEFNDNVLEVILIEYKTIYVAIDDIGPEEFSAVLSASFKEIKVAVCKKYEKDFLKYRVEIDDKLVNEDVCLKSIEDEDIILNFVLDAAKQIPVKSNLLKLNFFFKSKIYSVEFNPLVSFAEFQDSILSKFGLTNPYNYHIEHDKIKITDFETLEKIQLSEGECFLLVESEPKKLLLKKFGVDDSPILIELKIGTSISELRLQIEKYLKISPDDQLLTFSGRKLFDLDENKYLPDIFPDMLNQNEILIGVLECQKPYVRKVSLIIFDEMTKCLELEFDITKTISELKDELKSTSNIKEHTKQVWMIKDKELTDCLPLCIQKKSDEIINICLRVSKKLQLGIIAENGALKISKLIYDSKASVREIKELIFNQHKIEVKNQVLSLDYEGKTQLGDDLNFSDIKISEDSIIFVKDDPNMKNIIKIQIDIWNLESKKLENFNLKVAKFLSIKELKEMLKQNNNFYRSSYEILKDGQTLKNDMVLSFISEKEIILRLESFPTIEVIIMLSDSEIKFELPINLTIEKLENLILQKIPSSKKGVPNFILYYNEKPLNKTDVLSHFIDAELKLVIKLQLQLTFQIKYKDSVFEMIHSENINTVEIQKFFLSKISGDSAEFEFKNKQRYLLSNANNNFTENPTIIEAYKVICIEIFQNKELLPFKKNIRENKTIRELKEELKAELKLSSFSLNFEKIELKDDMLVEKYHLKSLEIFVRNEIIFKFGEKELVVEYEFNESVLDIKKKLSNKGIEDISTKNLILGETILIDNTKISDYKLNPPKTIMQLKPKSFLKVVHKSETFHISFTSLMTVGDIQEKLEDLCAISSKDQLLFIQDNENNYLEKLEKGILEHNSHFKDLENIKIQLKHKKIFRLKLGIHETPLKFEGCKNEKLLEQKKIFALLYKVDEKDQIWTKFKINEENDESELHNLEGNDFIENYKISLNDEIIVGRRVTICLNIEDKTIDIPDVSTIEKIKNIKEKAKSKVSIQLEDQQWFWGKNELIDDRYLGDYISNIQGNFLPVDVLMQNDLEYFGFSKKSPINMSLFKDFYREDQEILEKIIDNTAFSKLEHEEIFRNQLLGFFFGILKKHALWDKLIEKIKMIAFERRSVNLWIDSNQKKGTFAKFNTQYILYYILNCGNTELNLEIINLMKNHFPIPLVISTFEKRLLITGKKILEELVWTVQQSFTICSFGIGKASEKPCGKSEFNNKVFFTNFVENSKRNDLCGGCPEIRFDIYKNDKMLVNLIDIPSQTNIEFTSKIIKNSNMLILHTTLSKNETNVFLSSIKDDIKDIPIIILYRDDKDAFSKASLFKEKLRESVKNSEETNVFEIKLENLSSHIRDNELCMISEEIHNFVSKSIPKVSSEELWKFSEFFSENIQDIKDSFKKIEDKSSLLSNTVKKFQLIKDIERNEEFSPQEKTEKVKIIQNEVKKIGSAPEVTKLLEIINESRSDKNNRNPKYILDLFQNNLRLMKNKQTKDYYLLYTYVSKFSKKTDIDISNLVTEFENYWNSINTSNQYYDSLKLPSDKTKDSIIEFITNAIHIFEQKINTNIFSMELFWREMIYLTTLDNDLKIKPSNLDLQPTLLENLLLDINKKRILDGFPFEIIDGDLLHMSKDYLKKIFAGMNESVIVISVLGPQSSGKSTLLNFLFGCDFTTSSGRCTKGIYGTFLKLSNFNGCGGILLLDTEGLFGFLNKAESDRRDKFDRKLVLFCLAMSDFVLVNFRGDIDKNLSDLLMITLQQSLKKLTQHQPEMFLILNQNSDTSTTNHLQDSHKMADFGFRQENVKVLPLAFDIKKNIIKAFREPIVRKFPLDDFSNSCQEISSKIFETIEKNIQKQKTIEEVFDQMFILWETMDRYPSLLKHNNLNDQNTEVLMKTWISKSIEENLRLWVEENLDTARKADVKIVGSFERDFADNYEKNEKELKKNFESNFEKVRLDNLKLYEEMEINLKLRLRQLKTYSTCELTNLIQKKKIKIYDMQGEDNIRDAIKKIKKKPEEYDNDAKKKALFDEVWANLESSLVSHFSRDRESKSMLKIISDYYNNLLSTFSAGLPKSTRFAIDIQSNFDAYKIKLSQSLKELYQNQNTKLFEYTKSAPALILKGGKSNITFKYLDLKKYFEDSVIDQYFVLESHDLIKIFKVHAIRKEIKDSLAADSAEILMNISKTIHHEFLECGIIFETEKIFSFLDYETSRFWEIWKSKPKIELEKSSHVRRTYENKYINNQLLGDLIDNYFKLTSSAFTTKCLKIICIDKIKDNLRDKEKAKLHQNDVISKLMTKIIEDLEKINLTIKREDLKNILFGMLKEKPFVDRNYIKLLNSNPIRTTNFFYDLDQASLNYLELSELKKKINLKALNYNNYYEDEFKLAVKISKKKTVKKEYKDIDWLESYVNEDISKLYQNHSRNPKLVKFISNEFDFSRLSLDIFECCVSNISNEKNWNNVALYSKLCHDINNIIGDANNDLQQVAFQFDVDFVGNLHMSVVHLVWKYFDMINWEKCIEPLKEMRKRKEQQENYFFDMTSSDNLKKNIAQGKKCADDIQNYISINLLGSTKKQIINKIGKKFRENTMRQSIQKGIDDKYFSKGALIEPDELYDYILKPYDVLEAWYQNNINECIQDMKREIMYESQKVFTLVDEVIDRGLAVVQSMRILEEESYSYENVFKPLKFETKEATIFYKSCEEKLCYANFKFILGLLKGNQNLFKNEYDFDENTSVVYHSSVQAIQISECSNIEVLKLFNTLEGSNCLVLNGMQFLVQLIESLKELSKVITNSNSTYESEIESLKQETKYFICKQCCPCCDRICGEDDPGHKYHQCKYGHQIRGIAGIKLTNGDVSVARCEDIKDTDMMQYNGNEKNWMQFKEEMKNHPNNKWIFDDLVNTVKDKDLLSRFKYVWTQVGERICKERFEGSIKYVEYNQANLDIQNHISNTLDCKYYIFMIDTSGSMSGDKWRELKESLKKTLGEIARLNPKNIVAIINFSDQVRVECQGYYANNVNVEALTFQGNGTNFDNPFIEAYQLMIKNNKIMYQILFLTDGEASYPSTGIAKLKLYRSQYGDRYSFYGIGFKCTSSSVDKITQELGGKSHFAEDVARLSSVYKEIITRAI